MARHTYVTKGYSNYIEPESGYTYEPEQNVIRYVVETTTVERVRVPAAGYTKFYGARAPFIHERNYWSSYNAPKDHHEGYERNYGSSYNAPKDHHEGYEQNYVSSYEYSNPTDYHEMEDIMANFLNGIQIEASRPTGRYRTTSPNKYQPTSTDKYRHTSLNRYRDTSPDRYRPTSSINRHSSPDKYQHTSPEKYRFTSPNKYRHTSPNKYRSSSPNKYRYTSPTHDYPSKENHVSWPQTLSSPNKYKLANSTKFRPTSPTKKRSTSPTNYRPTSPIQSYPPKESQLTRAQNVQSSKYRATSPTHAFPSKEGHEATTTKRLSSPNKHLPSNPSADEAQHSRLGNFWALITVKAYMEIVTLV